LNLGDQLLTDLLHKVILGVSTLGSLAKRSRLRRRARCHCLRSIWVEGLLPLSRLSGLLSSSAGRVHFNVVHCLGEAALPLVLIASGAVARVASSESFLGLAS